MMLQRAGSSSGRCRPLCSTMRPRACRSCCRAAAAPRCCTVRAHALALSKKGMYQGASRDYAMPGLFEGCYGILMAGCSCIAASGSFRQCLVRLLFGFCFHWNSDEPVSSTMQVVTEHAICLMPVPCTSKWSTAMHLCVAFPTDAHPPAVRQLRRRRRPTAAF